MLIIKLSLSNWVYSNRVTYFYVDPVNHLLRKFTLFRCLLISKVFSMRIEKPHLQRPISSTNSFFEKKKVVNPCMFSHRNMSLNDEKKILIIFSGWTLCVKCNCILQCEMEYFSKNIIFTNVCNWHFQVSIQKHLKTNYANSNSANISIAFFPIQFECDETYREEEEMNTIYWNKTLANHADYFINSFGAHKRQRQKESRAFSTTEQNRTATERAFKSFCATK